MLLTELLLSMDSKYGPVLLYRPWLFVTPGRSFPIQSLPIHLISVWKQFRIKLATYAHLLPLFEHDFE